MSEQIKILVDGKDIKAKSGESLLTACLANDIYIPNLCHMEGMPHPPASCRLCFVEIEGTKGPVTSCAVQVENGMAVKTDTPDVRRLQRTALRLLLSVHDVSCKKCPANKKCELQKMAKFLGIGLTCKPFERRLKDPASDDSHPLVHLYLNRCVLCGKCVHVCGNQGPAFTKRGFETVVGFYGKIETPPEFCANCLACAEVCPTAAITLKTQT